MIYHVILTELTKKNIKKLDKYTASMILGWIRKNLEGCKNPRQHGKGLTANKTGEWRYRIGDYRVLAEINDGKIIILGLNIGHRRDIYK